MKKRILIDMDGVLVDFELEIEKYYPDFKNLSKAEQKAAVDDVCLNRDRNIFSKLKPVPGALEAYRKLCDIYEVYILSAPMWKLPESYTDKRTWVEEHLGDNARKRLILSHNKGIVTGDYLIDDRTKYGVKDFEGEHIHFGKYPFKDWDSIIDYLSNVDDWNYN